ncbi:Carboxylesterase type B [Penicillium cf. griseofulvum]|nr:Carboxylesterase type B [Penicillium cf. griseofulvum]
MGLKGWIVQDDFDTTLSRLPPNIRYNFLARLTSIIIFKDCLRCFWSNPFWYLECEGDFANSDDLETPVGAELNGLCEEYLKDLGRRWRTHTTRLANLRHDHDDEPVKPSREFGLTNNARRKAKAKQFADGNRKSPLPRGT